MTLHIFGSNNGLVNKFHEMKHMNLQSFVAIAKENGSKVLTDPELPSSREVFFGNNPGVKITLSTEGMDIYRNTLNSKADNDKIRTQRNLLAEAQFAQIETISSKETQIHFDDGDNGHEYLMSMEMLPDNYTFWLSSESGKLKSEAHNVTNYHSPYGPVVEQADFLLEAYANLYDQLVRGYEDGTREKVCEDGRGGYRLMTLEDEVERLNEAYEHCVQGLGDLKQALQKRLAYDEEMVEKYKNHPDLSVQLWVFRKETSLETQKNNINVIPRDLSERMMDAAKSFVLQYMEQNTTKVNILDILKDLKISNVVKRNQEETSIRSKRIRVSEDESA